MENIQWKIDNENEITLSISGDSTVIGELANKIYSTTNRIIRDEAMTDNFENRRALYELAMDSLSKKMGIVKITNIKNIKIERWEAMKKLIKRIDWEIMEKMTNKELANKLNEGKTPETMLQYEVFESPENTFKRLHKDFIQAGYRLSEAWGNLKDEAIIKKYPKYLPSFDEFIYEFAELLDD